MAGIQGTIIFVTILVVVAALVYRWMFSHGAKVKRALREGRFVSVRDFPEDADGRIEGRLAYASEPIVAPLTGRSCAYYFVEVAEYDSDNDRRRTLIKDRDGCDFFVEDDTGRALIRVRDATVAVHQDCQLRSGVLDDPSPGLVQYLNSHGESSEGLIFNRNLRYEEGVLEEGELVAVRGRGRWEDDPDPDRAGGGYRSRPKRLILDKPPQGELYVSDEPDLFK